MSGILLVAMITNAYMQFRDEVSTMEQVLKVRAQSLGQMLSSVSIDALIDYDVTKLNKYIQDVTNQAQVVHAVIVDTQGNSLTTYLDLNDIYIQNTLDTLNDVDSALIVSELEKMAELVSYTVPVLYEEEMLARAVVVLDNSDYVAASVAKFQEKVLSTLLIGLFVAMGAYFVFSRYILRPIMSLSAGANRIANSIFGDEIKVQGDSELTDLAADFNQMSENLELLIADRDSALEDLGELNIELEKRVQERTIELQALNVEIARQAMHDPLTELPNRTLLVERLKQNIYLARRKEKHVAFLMLDLNNFKEVNDTLGHPQGDRLLLDVASRLPTALRQSDTVGRLGGDEFGIVLPETDSVQALEVARKITESLQPSFELDGHAVSVGASIGIALFPEHADDEASLIRYADIAMYEAKRSKGDPCLYDPDADNYTTARLSLMNDLREAVENDELQLYFQPTVVLSTKKVHTVEALSRWEHPERGNILPEEFIPLAETSNLIGLISFWALEKSISSIASWKQQGADIMVSINLSARDLLNAELADHISRLCDKYDVEPSMLRIEISESVIMSNPEQVIEVINNPVLKQLKYAIDDFGTGYSSLSYLKKLPIDEVKIDRSFVLDMMQNAEDTSIVRSVIELAHNLGHKVVAEGVETEATLTQLELLGCDVVQGFYFSEAVAADVLLDKIDEIEEESEES
ncbi:MAG: EAL domain-containing protein [Gammaproteobacteria bacterium]|nr:EAL domain-containing protein [Gammaproteobacteria bacterium]NNJ51357.1 EAL domain-containing protein [Gammaproteobacteria bacterium]